MKTLPKLIYGFFNEYSYLSNYHFCKIYYEGLDFLSTEAAYQAMKTLIKEERVLFQTMGPAESKKAGNKVNLRPDWETIKDLIMRDLVFQKFNGVHEEAPLLKEMLLETKGSYLIEGNWWHDNHWGFCFCDECKEKDKKNMLGKILMEVRDGGA